MTAELPGTTLLILLPLFLALISFLVTGVRTAILINGLGYAAYFGTALTLVHQHFSGLTLKLPSPLLAVDSLTLLLFCILGIIGFAGALYSPTFIQADIERHKLRPFKFRKYFVLYNLLFFAMTVLTMADNLGVLWITVEATTLISAVLVSFDNRKAPVEAAWKFLMICSIGIAVALFGTILCYYAAITGMGPNEGSLSWKYLIAHAQQMDKGSMKLAFLFLLFGYGTKAGLVPMARWKPLAYGEAPASVSAILSGALVACAVYALMRISILSSAVLGTEVVSRYLIFFGALSVAFSTILIISEHDLKRLFAYSSVEHVGIIVLGIGFGTYFGIYGALLHMVNNSLIKASGYFSAGNIISATGEGDLRNISCTVRLLPLGTLALLGTAIAAAATPPSALFYSEFNILKGGILNSNYWSVGILLLSLFAVFAAFYSKFTRIAFGRETHVFKTRIPMIQQLIPSVLLILVLTFGVFVPNPVERLLKESAALFGVNPASTSVSANPSRLD